MNKKIKMSTPIVEMDGDEMTRVIWHMIKDILLLPYIDLQTEYYDLGLQNREKTKDQVTIDSANATKKYGVAVKCATITPNADRVKEYRFCFTYALEVKKDIWFATKDTISKIYDHRFKDIFNEIFENEFQSKFDNAGIEYFYTLIDDAVARVIRSHGGYIWACKNYDGDVMSDMVATAFGSLAMMTSVLVSPDKIFEYEAAHGTVQRHYYKHMDGKETSTNSMATIFAWTGALKKRGELDNLPELISFAEKLEKASIKTIEDGIMTGDLFAISNLENKINVNTKEFLIQVNNRLKSFMPEALNE